MNDADIDPNRPIVDDFGGSGIAVAPLGTNKIVIGDKQNTPGVGKTQAGAAYIYNLDGSNEIKITASDGDQYDYFGDSVGIGSNRIVVGAPGYNKGGSISQVGAVYIFDLSGNQLGIITASDGAGGDRFGTGVEIESDKIIVAAGSAQVNGTSSVGAIYVYNLDGSNETKINPTNASANDRIGYFGVSVASNKIVAGAPFDWLGPSLDSAGSTFVFDLNLTNPPVPPPKNYGNFSWGRFSNLTRATSPQSYTVSGNTVSGLSTYPQIQRRGFGLNDGGAYSN
jgi:hypothetical protein